MTSNAFKARRGTETEYKVYELLVSDGRIVAIRAEKYLDRNGYEWTRVGRTVVLKPSRELCGWWFDDFTIGNMMCVYSDEFIEFYNKIAARLKRPLREHEVIDVVDKIIGEYHYRVTEG